MVIFTSSMLTLLLTTTATTTTKTIKSFNDMLLVARTDIMMVFGVYPQNEIIVLDVCRKAETASTLFYNSFVICRLLHTDPWLNPFL